MKIILTGASGLVGSALGQSLESQGHSLVKLVRRAPQSAGEATWNPDTGEIDAQALEGSDALIHLAGENIAGHRWTDEFKEKIRDSRMKGTRLLVDTLMKLQKPPQTFICASAVGFYGDRGEEWVTEASPAGVGFLPQICREWEETALKAAFFGVRTICLRIGIVLSPKGGALARMLPPFKMGLGGPIGSGNQYMSWVTLTDLVRVMDHVLNNSKFSGPVNAVSPHPVPNAIFSKTLAQELHRPSLVRTPALALKLALGEMAEALILSGQRVKPAKLIESGFQFEDTDLAQAFKKIL